MTTVLFACVHNAGRSPMAAALLNAMADPARARAISAGTDPGPRVHADVIAAMCELDLDLSAAIPRRLTEDVARGAQWLITMGCGDRCPVVPGVRRDDWPLADPRGRSLPDVRRIRDEIVRRVQSLVISEGWLRTDHPWTPIAIEDARPEDASAILDLLERSHLPPEGLLPHLAHAIVARQNGRVVGSAAVEVYRDGGLLRSVAVDEGWRGAGLGRRLTEAALIRAALLKLPATYLLTTTAEGFFPRFGFTRVSREDVPDSIRASVEFTSACPASAIVMRKTLA